MNLQQTKPKDFPAVYGFADEFFSKVQPGIDLLLNPNRRILTLTQTITGAYDFHSFLLDFPKIRVLLQEFDDSNLNISEFWTALEKVSVQQQFRNSNDYLKKVFNDSHESLKNNGEKLKLNCQIKKLAFASIAKFAPNHFEPKIFDDCFAQIGKGGRGERILRMQEACVILQKQTGLEDELLDLSNLILYRNSFAYHAFNRIRQILNEAKEHALGYVTLTVPNEQYVQRKWQDIMVWYGANKKLGDVSKLVFPDDPEACDYFSMVFYLRDYAFPQADPVDIKISLLSRFLKDRRSGMKLLRQVVAQYPIAARIWIKKKLEGYRLKAD